MALFPELRHQPPEALMRWFVERGREKEVPDEEGELWLGEVAVQIAKVGTKGIEFLLGCLPDADEQRLRAALLALSTVGKKLSARLRDQVCARARTFLNDTRPLVVAEAVDTLQHLGCPQVGDDVFSLLKHPSPYVVGSVLRYLACYEPTTAVPILEYLLESREPVVRSNAIDELDELEYLPALPKIRRLLEDADENVRLAARSAVSNLEEVERERSEGAKGPRDRPRKESIG